MPSKPPVKPRFQVGIDLGTTNTVVAYAELGNASSIQPFPVEQLVGPGQIAARPTLPSTRYHPAPGELATGAGALPWQDGETAAGAVLGEYARVLGAKAPGRLITSAKSWLCHRNVDRLAAILPWNGAEGVTKVSPVTASASYLAHVRHAWNHHFPKHPLERQKLVLTVPASFETLARQLTLEAARQAGLSEVSLLEEPQAACYHWLWLHQAKTAAALADCRILLVIDIGGGTTDFSLIRIDHGPSEVPVLNRIAVGDHLMLGGDNIDLALAHLAESRLQPGTSPLSAGQFAELLEQCRGAKEALLQPEAPVRHPITLLGSGSRLVGGSRTVELTRDEVRDLVLDGFFPQTLPDELPQRKRSGVVEFGLPYAADPAVTKHIAAFLHLHRESIAAGTGGNPIPDAVLLNGGLFRSPPLADRILQTLAAWRQVPLRTLTNQHPETAVACGAVAYGLAQRGILAQSIRSSAARSYFLLLEDEAPQRRGVCLLPKGTEAANQQELADRNFALSLGRPVGFRLACTSDETPYRVGQITDLADDRFSPLPPLSLSLQSSGGKEVTVRLASSITELGDLHIRCIEQADPATQWELVFQLNEDTVAAQAATHPRLNEAAALIAAVFGKKSKGVDPKQVKSLRSELERLFGKRAEWPLPLLRGLFDQLLQGSGFRRRSPEHEKLWLNLAGFCLRPGQGAPLDDWRIEQLWPIHRQGIQHSQDAQVWSEWWILWRRAAAGLDGAAQQAVFAEIAPYLDPHNPKRSSLANLARKRGYEDMLRLGGSLERIPATVKADFGGWLLALQGKGSEPEVGWWALGRIGTRVPLYGSAHEVVATDTVERWLRQLLELDWRKQALCGFAATLMARLSGDRGRDLEAASRQAVVEKLQASKCPRSWVEMVSRVTDLTETEAQHIYGEALPPGLRLLPASS